MKVLIAEDHGLYREGLKVTLTGILDNPIILEAERESEVISLMEAHADLDLVLLDLHFPDGGGLRLVRRIKHDFPFVPIAVLSADDSPIQIRKIMAEGVNGYLTKTARNQVLQHALQIILSGGIYVPDTLAFDEPQSTPTFNCDLQNITPRQQQVLSLLAQGFSNKEIGRTLHLAEGTVKAHVAALLKLLGVRNRTEAANKARDLDIVDA